MKNEEENEIKREELLQEMKLLEQKIELAK